MKASDKIIDEWLVINCQAGDSQSFELLVKRWNPSMLRRVYHTTKDQEASEDIVQEAWITIIKKIRKLKDPRAFPSWSLKIATFLAIDWIRANQRDRKREDIRKEVQLEFGESPPQANDSLLSTIKETIENLPEEQRQIVKLFYQENLGINTISQLLNIPVGTVKSRLFRGREYLKDFLKDKFYDHEGQTKY